MRENDEELFAIKNKWTLKRLITVLVMSFMILCAGLFLFWVLWKTPDAGRENGNTDNITKEKEEDITTQKPFPVVHTHLSRMVNGNRQEINIIEVKLTDSRALILPVLADGELFGFETLSTIARENGAYAAVNGGFFTEYGYPSGMFAINGELMAKSTGKYPVFITDGSSAAFKFIENRLWVEYDSGRIDIDNINLNGKSDDVILYTPAYGLTNRAEHENITATIIDGKIVKIAGYKDKANIPERGMLLSFYLPSMFDIESLPFKEGDRVEFRFEPELGDGVYAYECGSFIVRDGEIVIENWDEWVGVMTNRDPRTVIGIKDESTVVLLTVDGRQPGYSTGLTGKELGKLLLEIGVKNAAMLDGGASTEMIVEDVIINRPSFKGQERPLGGGVIVKIESSHLTLP